MDKITGLGNLPVSTVAFRVGPMSNGFLLVALQQNHLAALLCIPVPHLFK